MLKVRVSAAANIIAYFEIFFIVVKLIMIIVFLFPDEPELIGYADAEFDIKKVDVKLASKAGEVHVCENGAGVEFSEEIAKKVLLEDEIRIIVSVGDGQGKATAYGCDLTYDYVKINGDYRS